MLLFQQIYFLIKKDLVLEWRNKNAFYSILLYLGSTTFVCYLSVGIRGNSISPLTWNALFWIILLFTSINAVSKSFLQENRGRYIYYYMIAQPQSIILAKIIYNAVLLGLLSLAGLLFYSLVLESPVQNMALFILNVVLGATGFSSTFTLLSAIASKTTNGNSLMAILSIPIVIPMLLLLMKISKFAIDGLSFSSSLTEIILLISINFMVLALSYILFPYLWRS